jgi:hypothetical protein
MRVAFIGLSSPSTYLFDHDRQYWGHGEHWNPVLESPIGLICLYHEIWFAHRALCPISMRGLPYVRFLDRDPAILPILENEITHASSAPFGEYEAGFPSIKYDSPNTSLLPALLKRTTGLSHGDIPYDNHSLPLNFGAVMFSGNTWSKRHLALDLVIAERLLEVCPGPSIDLITNTFTSSSLIGGSPNEYRAAHEVVVRRLPYRHTVIGPDISEVDYVRENKYIGDFREKIASASGYIEIPEVEEMVRSIETEFARYRNDVLIKKHGEAGTVMSIGRSLLSVVSGLLPLKYLSEGASLVNDMETRQHNWTAFLAMIENDTMGAS